jgi:hypothetical protein
VCGKVEVDGISYFDGTVSIGNTATVADDTSFQFGTDGDAVIKYSTAQSYGDGLMITPPINSKNIIVTRYMNRNYDHYHANNDNPTLYIHSGSNISQNVNYQYEYVSISTDNVSTIIDSGINNVTIADNTIVEGNLVVGDRDVGITSFEMYDDGTNIQMNVTTPKPFVFNSNITLSRTGMASFYISTNTTCIFAVNSTGAIKDIMCNG